jgi:UDP-N-acetylmuramoylalanine--D-glutamate ligase
MPGTVLWFGKAPQQKGVGLDNEHLVLFNPGRKPEPICRVSEVAIPGEHNLENAMAAAAAAWAAGADPAAIGRALRAFRGIEHRLEFVDRINEVEYVNDSKGTNPGATLRALASFPGKRKILIAGGMDKGADFTQLARVIAEEVSFLVLLGETKGKIAAAMEQTGFRDYILVADLEEAVDRAQRAASAGDLVLLSPACASWDMFKNFEVRGNRFKELVHALKC